MPSRRRFISDNCVRKSSMSEEDAGASLTAGGVAGADVAAVKGENIAKA